MNAGIIADLRLRAQKKTIHELRQIARAVGVSRPSDGKKERIIEEIIKIATCEILPAPRNARGAPPKSSVYDEQFVADIENCAEYFSSLKNGAEPSETEKIFVSDGAGDYECAGILCFEETGKFLRKGCFPSSDDVPVHESFINRFDLKEGDFVTGLKTGRSEGFALTAVTSVNGFPPENLRRIPYENLTPLYPDRRLDISTGENAAARMVDLFAPAGFGQRGVICGSESCGAANILKQIASAICRNHPGLKVVVHVIAGRPEDINYLRRELPAAELYCTSFSDGNEEIIEAAEFVGRYCKRLAECGNDVVLLGEGLSRLEYAAREEGVRGAAKRFLSSAICAEEGGSLTVICTASPEDGELKRSLLQAANMWVELKESYALQGIDPAVDVLKTFTSNNGKFQPQDEINAAAILRKRVIDQSASPSEIAEIFRRTENNGQILKELTDG